MVWLVIALPALAVVVGITMLVIAIRSGGDDAVIDPVQRTAQIQTISLGPDARARELKLSAVLQVDGGQVLLLPATGEWGRGTTIAGPAGTNSSGGAKAGDGNHEQPLTLLVSHPTDAGQDLRLQLQPTELGWRIELEDPLDLGHDWLLQLTPPDGSWRLHGRLPATRNAVRLGPALPENPS